MKKVILLASVMTLLSGCEKNDTPAAFTPEMASFSNEFDFDPLRGPVKDFSQTLLNEKGEVAKRVSAQVSPEGCFDMLEFHNIEDDTGALLSTPPSAGTAAEGVVITLPNPDAVWPTWQNFRYKTFQTVVPLRNITMQGAMEEC